MVELIHLWLSPLAQFFVLLVGCFFIGVVFSVLAMRQRYGTEKARLEERLLSREEKILGLEQEEGQLREELRKFESQVVEFATRLQAERQATEEKVATFERTKNSLLDTFKALSADALQHNNQSFLALATQNLSVFQEGAKAEFEKRTQAIDELVKPLRNSLEKVDTKIQDLEQARTTAYVGLHEQIRILNDTHASLRAETSGLVKALRSPSAGGRWGEMQLRRVVEMAGMLNHCDFFEQESADTEEGRKRPDMVVKMPNGREIAVDAKVPFDAYYEAMRAESDERKIHWAQEHARIIRDHMTKLGQKSYWQHLESIDFVVLFLPGETFYSAALEQDPELINFGVSKKVLIATPVTLIALLRAVAYGWRDEALAEHARTIHGLGKDLYDRIRTMADHVVRVGKGLETAVDGYNLFVGSLENRVLVSARRFQELESGSAKEISGPSSIEKTVKTTKLETNEENTLTQDATASEYALRE